MKSKFKTELIRVCVGIPAAELSALFYACSIYRQYHPDSGAYLPLYFAGGAVGTSATVANYGARTREQPFPNKYFGYGAILVATLQTAGSILASTTPLQLPPVFSVGMSALAMLFSEGLNWKSRSKCDESYKDNKGRYFGFFACGATVTFSIINVIYKDTAYYFLASASFAAAVGCGLLNRKEDIINNDTAEEKELPDNIKDKIVEQLDPLENIDLNDLNVQSRNKRLIKIYVVCVGGTFIIDLILSGIKKFQNTDFNPPIALPNCLLLSALPFYLTAQSKISLGQICSYLVKKVTSSCTKISDSIRNCTSSVRHVFNKAVSCCWKRSKGEKDADLTQSAESIQPPNSYVLIKNLADEKINNTQNDINFINNYGSVFSCRSLVSENNNLNVSRPYAIQQSANTFRYSENMIDQGDSKREVFRSNGL